LPRCEGVAEEGGLSGATSPRTSLGCRQAAGGAAAATGPGGGGGADAGHALVAWVAGLAPLRLPRGYCYLKQKPTSVPGGGRFSFRGPQAASLPDPLPQLQQRRRERVLKI